MSDTLAPLKEAATKVKNIFQLEFAIVKQKTYVLKTARKWHSAPPSGAHSLELHNAVENLILLEKAQKDLVEGNGS